MASAGTGKVAGVPFSEATKVEQLDVHTYRVELQAAFCIGAGAEKFLPFLPPSLQLAWPPFLTREPGL
jgi:hypothetical protein